MIKWGGDHILYFFSYISFMCLSLSNRNYSIAKTVMVSQAQIHDFGIIIKEI